MRIRTDINVMDFLRQVQKCRSEVLFETPEGDSIALKSTLSQYIFCNIAQNVPMLESGSIRFSRKADEEILKEYLCE